MGELRFRTFILTLLCLSFVPNGRSSDSTWAYTVQLSATAQFSPPRIVLAWHPDPYGVDSYVVYRKSRDATSWGAPVATLSGSITNYTDENVTVGSAYEYQVVKLATLGYVGYGYIYAGIQAPMIESRGKLILLVASNLAQPLANELALLESDLIGDGWQVIRHDIATNDLPSNVRSIIKTDYWADPANVSAVFLFGRIPILHSGVVNYDGHLDRAMPADAFYGEMTDDWPVDPASSPSFMPSPIELMVGRVDLAGMPGAGAPVAWPSEIELMRNYLRKDHAWRHALLSVPRRALMGNRRGDESGEATAASGYRNFEPFVGPGQTIEANTEDLAPVESRWISRLSSEAWLLAYGCGAGQPTAISGLGTQDGGFNDVWSTDVVGGDAKSVFTLLFGSWFGNWDYSDNIMRSFLATPTMGLAACMAGRPHWFIHHMGLGEPIGFGVRLTMNNSTLYQNNSNAMAQANYIALMGDPTLRLDPVPPPTGLLSHVISNQVNLAWSASTSQVQGYYVYRAATSAGPYTRLTPNLVASTTFSDSLPGPTTRTYMVRAVRLESHFSGSYYNPSQGAFVTVSSPALVPQIRVTAARNASGVSLSWASEPGVSYHVQAQDTATGTGWLDASGTIVAEEATTSWTDPVLHASRFYRVISP